MDVDSCGRILQNDVRSHCCRFLVVVDFIPTLNLKLINQLKVGLSYVSLLSQSGFQISILALWYSYQGCVNSTLVTHLLAMASVLPLPHVRDNRSFRHAARHAGMRETRSRHVLVIVVSILGNFYFWSNSI